MTMTTKTTIESLKSLETKISNLEGSLWFILSILDPDIHKSLKEKLIDTANKLDEKDLPNYIDYANLLMDIHDEDPKELLFHLIDLLVTSEPNSDKILDVNRIMLLENYLDKNKANKLNKFQSACLRGSNEEKD